ncbi:MAG: type II toxin-antitoxin system ParD family antitoxin [Deltaproteobacteria bacterium]|nr:type II toxin-antitoxin system ParD family antitoxin [Deltaproteobacteria bacterium]
MAKRESISVSFTPQQAAFLASCVATGRYQSASEVVREAIRLLEDQQAKRHAQLERVQQLVEEGARQLDAAEGVELGGVLSELATKHARLEER